MEVMQVKEVFGASPRAVCFLYFHFI